MLGTGWEQQLCKWICRLKLCSDLVWVMKMTWPFTLFPWEYVSTSYKQHRLNTKQALSTPNSWWETPTIWTAGILQVHIICISGTACGTCIISTINGLTSQVLMFSEYQASCFWDKDSERKMTMIISSWKCCKILHFFFYVKSFFFFFFLIFRCLGLIYVYIEIYINSMKMIRNNSCPSPAMCINVVCVFAF